MSGPRGLLAILGATATGKSALAVALAERLGGEVVNADAFAVYRGLDAGTAKPTVEERRGIPHHLIDIREPWEPFTAGDFARLARDAVREILGRGRLPILCGGTGFYVRAFFEGLFEGPPRYEAVRDALRKVAERRGTTYLARALSLLDPESAVRVAPADAARTIRYLEIGLRTGRRPSDLFRSRPVAALGTPSVRILLTLPRPVLYERISERFNRSIAKELPREVRRILASGVSASAPGFRAIGYRETASFVEGGLPEPEWRDAVVRATRRFAKRQETWFRAEPELLPLDAGRPDLLEAALAAARPLFDPSHSFPFPLEGSSR